MITSEYSARVASLCSSVGMDLEEKQRHSLIMETWFNRLPYQMQNVLNQKIQPIIREGSIQEFLNMIISDIPQAPPMS